MKFLSGKSLSDAIRRVTSGSEVRCAVAFWGKGAAEALGFLGRAKNSRPRIICDISMGGTNAAELRALGAPRNSRLRYREDFHAKVYLSELGVVIASANASDRGVGFQADGKLIEAGILAQHDPAQGSLWSDADAWFDEQWRTSNQVNGAALERADELWARRQAAALRRGAPSGGARGRASLLDLVRDNPRLFDNIGFVFVDNSAPPAEKARNLERDWAELRPGDKKIVQFTNWGRDFERWPECFFEFWKPGQRISLYWRKKRAVLPVGKPKVLYAETPGWRSIGPIGKWLLPSTKILEVDDRLLRRIFDRSPNSLFSSGAELAAELEKLR